VLEREGRAGGDRQDAGDNPGAQRKIEVGRAAMQRAGLAAGIARSLAEDLGEGLLGISAAREQVTVIAMGAVDVVVGLKHRHDADAGCFLADIDVEVAGHLTPVRRVDAGLLEASDQEHRPKRADAAVTRQSRDHRNHSLQTENRRPDQ
jgi:hypothetical protein